MRHMNCWSAWLGKILPPPYRSGHPLVLEFNSNYLGGSSYFITIRGKSVPCDLNAIRKVYDLQLTDDKYNELFQQ